VTEAQLAWRPAFKAIKAMTTSATTKLAPTRAFSVRHSAAPAL